MEPSHSPNSTATGAWAGLSSQRLFRPAGTNGTQKFVAQHGEDLVVQKGQSHGQHGPNRGDPLIRRTLRGESRWRIRSSLRECAQLLPEHAFRELLDDVVRALAFDDAW